MIGSTVLPSPFRWPAVIGASDCWAALAMLVFAMFVTSTLLRRVERHGDAVPPRAAHERDVRDAVAVEIAVQRLDAGRRARLELALADPLKLQLALGHVHTDMIAPSRACQGTHTVGEQLETTAPPQHT